MEMELPDLPHLQKPVVDGWILRRKDERGPVRELRISISMQGEMNDRILVERQSLEVRLCCICTQQNGVRLRQVSGNGLDFVAAFRQRHQLTPARARYCPPDHVDKRCRRGLGYPRRHTEERWVRMCREITPMPQKIEYGPGGSNAQGVRRQKVLASISKRTEWQQLQLAVRDHEDIRFRSIFRYPTQQAVKELLRQGQVPFSIHQLRTVLRSLFRQFAPRRQNVAVSPASGDSQCKRVGFCEHIFHEKLGGVEILFEPAECHRNGRCVDITVVVPELLFCCVDGVENLPSGSRIVGIKQLHVKAGQL